MNQVSSQPIVANYSASRAAVRGTANEGAGLPWTENGLELEYPARFDTPARLGHIPFLFWIVGALRPRIIVELGVGRGNSYFTFLQAASQLGLDVRCFGIDPWLGNAGEDTHRELCSYHDPRYGAFSTLLRSSYDPAASYFADGAIDLLHIDGTRSYDTVSHDFKMWLPKVSSRGIVMFHDTNVRAGEFGAWQIWEDVTPRYPTFEFVHADGLGLAYVGNEPLLGALKALFDRTSRAGPSEVRTYFARLGVSVQEHVALREAEAKIASADLRLQSIEAERAREAVATRELEKALHEERRKINAPAADRYQNPHWLRQQMALVIRLQREVSALNRHKLEWEQILQSTSWRVTAPLRWLVIKLRFLLSKLTIEQK